MNALATPVAPAGQVFRDRSLYEDLHDLCPNARVIIDAGAGEGGFAREALNLWPEAVVHSYEPASRFNLKLQGGERHWVHRVGLWSRAGAAQLNLTHGPESNSFLEYLPVGPLCRIHHVIGHEQASIVPLDGHLESGVSVDVLKLDVQGSELQVLEGAKQTIARDKPVILTEVAFQPQYKDHPLLEDIDAWMGLHGYRRLHLYASPMPDIWGDAIYVPILSFQEYVARGWKNLDAANGGEFGESSTVRLNIGAGDTIIPGFTAIDRKLGTEAYPLDYPDNSVDEIRCVHMLEHLNYAEVLDALKEWHRVLKPGARLRVSVPDVCKVIAMRESNPQWHFYLMGGQTDADDFHKSAWDEDRLRGYLENFGFDKVQPWQSQNTDLASASFSLNLEGFKTEQAPASEDLVKIRAVIGMPRIGWNDSWQSIIDAMQPFGIPIETHQGCFWGQNIQKALERAQRDGIDWVVTLDYDSLILPKHLQRLLEIMGSRPDIDAIAALQMRRGAETPLFTNGKTEAEIDGSPVRVNTAHFGLTVLRVECLKDMEKPWLIDVPDKDGGFGGEHTDADITFWKKWTGAGHSVHVAPDVRIGHLELLVSEFDEELKPRHFHIGDWWNRHAKAGHCLRSKKEV